MKLGRTISAAVTREIQRRGVTFSQSDLLQ